jgi:hypothetical protein
LDTGMPARTVYGTPPGKAPPAGLVSCPTGGFALHDRGTVLVAVDRGRAGD